MYASNYFEAQMLNLMKGQNITAPSNLYLALFLSNPGDTGADGTEITYAGYQRQLITFSAPAPSGTGLSMQNTSLISFAESTTSAGQVTYVAVFDSLTAGNMLLYGQLDTPLNVQPNVSPVFRAGTVTWIWTGNLSTYYRTAIMNTFRGTSLSGFTPYLAFCTGDPTGAGNEFSGNNYSRIAIGENLTTPQSGSSGASYVQNTVDLVSSIATGAWGTYDTAALYDAATGGHAFMVIPTGTSYNIGNGYSITCPAGALQVNVN